MSADTTDRERLRLAATLARAFPSGWFIDFVEAREAAYQILTRLVEKGTPLTYDGSASGELSASPDRGANNAPRESGSMPAPAADPSMLTLPRQVAEAALIDFQFVQGSDFDGPTFPGMDRLRTLLGDDVSLVSHAPGDFHSYRTFCVVCGGFGQVVLSLEPQRAGPIVAH